MESFIEIIDTYISNYPSYNINEKIIFECEYGELIFFKDNSDFLIIFGIFIEPKYRQRGFCREILYYLIDNGSTKFKKLCVQSVLSKILYEYLLRFNYKNKNFKLKQDGFYLHL
jgi:hypothetical protein